MTKQPNFWQQHKFGGLSIYSLSDIRYYCFMSKKSVCRSPGHDDATFRPKCCNVSLQEIQDRIRIIELYAKDRQFADFVRQHQAWVALSAFTFVVQPGEKDAGQTSQEGRWNPSQRFFHDGFCKNLIFKVICLVGKNWRWIYHCRVVRQPGLEVLQCTDNPLVFTPSTAEVLTARRSADTFWARLCQCIKYLFIGKG